MQDADHHHSADRQRSSDRPVGEAPGAIKPLALIKPYFLERWPHIVLGLLCLITVDFLQLMVPRVIKWAVDDLTALRIDLGQLGRYALYIAGLGVLMSIFRYFWRQCLLGTSRRVEEALRNRLLEHLQTLSAAYFDRTKTGDLMAHATNDLQQIRMATGMGMVALNDAIVLGLAAIGFMLYINVKLTLFVLIPMPLIIFGTRFFSRKMHRRYRGVQAAFADLTEVVRERFAGIRIIKAFNRESSEIKRLDDISGAYVRQNIQLVRITGAFFPMMGFLTNISLAIILYLGGRQTITATITPGDFVAFISYLGLITWPMMAMGWVTNLIQRGAASLERLAHIFNTLPEIKDAPDARSLENVRGELVFDNVTFRHGPKGPAVLQEINLRLKPGEVLGLIGPPGSGKTSLVNLIARLYDVTSGRILLDEIDIRRLKLADLRRQIAFLPQEPFLFAGTVRQNITFDNSGTRQRLMQHAAEAAAIADTVAEFSQGYDTVVGERGVILSGGQKQRVALARALLVPTPLLILDDPISQVDTGTAARILSSLRSMAGQRTMVIVSHRLSAVRFADQIIALEAGRVIEAGNHEQLMAQDGYYARTFRMQELEEQVVRSATG